ncbi:MAG: TetR/AcrR family transcriptional regulator [Lactobacillus equicursoris]|uniref:TetR/AcrR family transcriptional regulator n=1 Tax=Lactobacillus equicursoris TaxID=420645 RepID=UPI00242BAAC4|nr:TetR/AcrR family transcriptional regulator [Lactobacillus equicursoris]MDD6407130.1 TetR/AcrR family transcriptional regulator [Lactobacillus equicursoris]
MPKQTFFNLPKEKRDRIIAAAKEVFSKNSYEEASINQIVKLAQIPRGSFYQYFEDKDDLYGYLSSQMFLRMIDAARQKLPECDYDPFKLSEQILPSWLEELFTGEDSSFYYRRLEMFHRRQMPHLKRQVLDNRLLDNCLSDEEMAKITAKVKLGDASDFDFMVQCISMAFYNSIRVGFINYEATGDANLDELKAKLLRDLHYLEVGFEK